jgi:hypothetical protein
MIFRLSVSTLRTSLRRVDPRDSIDGSFSPGGLLVYAVEGLEIPVYVFNPHTGLLTARTVIKATGVGSILP